MKTAFHSISPRDEMVAYETLLAQNKASLIKVSKLLRDNEDVLHRPTEMMNNAIDADIINEIRPEVETFLENKEGFSVCVTGDFHYPTGLLDDQNPVALFYFKGDIGLLESQCISVVGARACSDEGARRAVKAGRILAENDITVVSGLATGIDTNAMKGAINAGGKVIGVIGTPIDQYYPKENRELQDEVAHNHLLISQVPFYKYEHDYYMTRRYYFPERNKLMAAISSATLIVEASERSGTLTQARAAIQQKRKLMIMNSCFEREDITWPAYYEKRGALRVASPADILTV